MDTTVSSKGHMESSGGTSAAEFHWGREQVLALISSVEEFFEDFYDGTKKKKTIWNCVAEHMRKKGYHCSGSDCDKKWRNLKNTYIRVLQKQVHGDSSSRFEYFDALHHILGQEIDPLGMREQALSQDVSTDSEAAAEFQELMEDDGFLWTSEEVYQFLDCIMECQEAFASPDTIISTVWEDIAQQMSQMGQEVSSEQCQRKWLNLQEGFRVHQAQAETTGVVPLWAFYTRTREVLNTVNVRITHKALLDGVEVLRERKAKSSTQEGPRHSSSQGKGRSARAREGHGRSVLARVKHIESTLNVKQRLDRLETRVASSRQQQEATRKTNILLVQALTELRRINAALNQEEPTQGVQNGQARPPDPGSCSPNQEFIIVEAYTDQL